MSVTPATVNKFLKTLRDGNCPSEKWTALTCITSHAGKGLSHSLAKVQFTELCGHFLEMISTCDAKILNDVTKSFNIILKEFINHEPTLFRLGAKLDKSKRFRFFDFLKTVDATVFSQLLTDHDIIKFLQDCLEVVDPKFMKWLAKDSITNIEILKSTENDKLDDKDEARKMAFSVMEFLQRIYDHASRNPTFNISLFHIFVLDKIATLAYMGYSKQRDAALKLLKSAVSQGLVAYMRDTHPASWATFKTTLHDTFSPRMTLLVTYKYPIWSRLWSLTIQMLGTEAHKNSALINELLCVEEKAFKSSETEVRKQAFLCWKHLIDNFALNPEEFNISKRVKLLCIPLNAKNSKIEVIAVTKLEVWWHLICTMFAKKTTQHVSQVIVQFLNFCFGPLGDTPLLSKKQNLVASPGKIFFKTKLCAIDALLQMMVMRYGNRALIPLVLQEKLATAIPIEIFEENHKSFLHSVSEAVIMMTILADKDLKNRSKLPIILWSNLMQYIAQSSAEKRSNMYKEMILVMSEMISHCDDSPLIIDLVLNSVMSKFIEVAEDLMYRDCTLTDLLTKILSSPILEKIQNKNIDDVRVLIEHAVKHKNFEMYHPNILPFVKKLLDGLSAALSTKVQHSHVIDLWCILADLITRYMGDDQPINEGTDLSHNLVTLETLVNFPFKSDITYTRSQVTTVAVYWKHLYKEFDLQADRIPSIKHNLILNTTARVMVDALSRSEKYFLLLAHCLTPLMETINYERLPTTGQVPSLIYVLRDVIMLSIKHNCKEEAEVALQAMDAYLISVYGLNNAQRTLLYLESLKPSIELLLHESLSVGLEREVVNTFEHVIIIVQGSTEALSTKFIASFRNILLLARRHSDPVIVNKVGLLFELKDVRPDVRYLLAAIDHEAKQPLIKRPIIDNAAYENKSVRPIKIVGSFLGKIIDPSKTFKAPEVKKERTVPPPDPDSQDYVVIKSDPKFDVNRLTEHQKECLKRRREDLSMFNEGSQSASTDTQDLQQWFDKSRLRNESNKENTMSVDASSSKQDEKSLKVVTPVEIPDKQIEKASHAGPDKPMSPIEEVNSEASGSGLSQAIVKKLDFESREEFPEGVDTKEASSSDQALQEPLLPTVKVIPSSPHSLKSKRGRHGRGGRSHLDGYDTMDRHLKRKAGTDTDSFNLDSKRIRKNEDTSDSENIHSTESQSDTNAPATKKPSGPGRLSEHARREISRLKIDMVADRVFPTVSGRRRSKQKGDEPEDHTLRSKSLKVDRDVSENEQSQELLKKRRRRSIKSEPETGLKGDTSPTTKRYESREHKLNSSSESDDKSVELVHNEDNLSERSDKLTDVAKPLDTSDKPAETSDHDEIVENSQQPVVRSPQRRVQIRNEASSPSTSRTPKSTPGSPKTQKSNDPDDTFIEEIKAQDKMITVEMKKLSEDSTKSPGLVPFATAVLASSSPQCNQRKFVKVRSHGMSPHGRGAHMLGLISAAPLNRDKSDDEPRKEPDSSSTPKSRSAILRNPERVSSPSGRQEKIFNNMKVAEFSSPSQSAFSNLKNDGEKVSPKMDKPKETTPIDHDYAEPKEIDISVNEELPLLEWSSANPPSLTASPSFSILKRTKTFPLESDGDVTPKRKRVSFADPPVSKQMGYFIPSPSKLNRSGILRLASRKDTPPKVKSNRPRMFVTVAADTSVMDDVESLTEVDRQRQKDNELLAKIADDLEEDDDVNFDSDGDDIEDKGQKAGKTDVSKVDDGGIIETASNTSSTDGQAPLTTDDTSKPLNQSLNLTDDSILGKLLNDEPSKTPDLEETLDIQNLSRFNSSGNSDELFVNKVPRTSTQLAAIAAAAEADTLPITDSMLLSQTMSQCSQGTQNSITLPGLEQLDSITPICHSLIGCDEPLSTIINDLTNPLWVSHLAKWFQERALETIGDLAKMSEKQISDIPTKGDPKAAYVKEVLEKFEKNHMKIIEKSLSPKSTNSSPTFAALPNDHIEIIEETIEVASADRDDEDTMSATSEDTTASISMNSTDNSKNQSNMEIDSAQTQETQNDYGSMIINSMSPPVKTSTSMGICTGDTLSVEASVDIQDSSIEELLEQIEPKISKASKVSKSIDGNKSKDKSNDKTNSNVVEPDDMLKTSCSAIGLDGVLIKLPDIFGNSQDVMTKILELHGTSVSAEAVGKYLKLDVLKKAIGEKCSSKDLCDLTAQALESEEKQGVVVDLKESLDGLLMRVPKELVSGASDKGKIVSSSVALDDGLDSNSAKVVESKVNGKDAMVDLCGSRNMSKEQLRKVFTTAADQMSSAELLEAFHETMQKKLKSEGK